MSQKYFFCHQMGSVKLDMHQNPFMAGVELDCCHYAGRLIFAKIAWHRNRMVSQRQPVQVYSSRQVFIS